MKNIICPICGKPANRKDTFTYCDRYVHYTKDGVVWHRVKQQENTNENQCVMCGVVIPEGRQLCPHCEIVGPQKSLIIGMEKRAGMRIGDIISSLLDQARDRDYMAKTEAYNIFAHDAAALRAAVKMLEEVRSADSGAEINIPTVLPCNNIGEAPVVTIKDKMADRWHEAREHLNTVIAEYVDVGVVGSYALSLTLLPLKHRLDDGEQTDELYNEIMECK